jgi:hypothetical protein
MNPNDAIGYTDDGLVFLVLNGELDGKPFQSMAQWTVPVAREIAKHLINAANKAEQKTNERNSPNFNN